MTANLIAVNIFDIKRNAEKFQNHKIILKLNQCDSDEAKGKKEKKKERNATRTACRDRGIGIRVASGNGIIYILQRLIHDNAWAL